MAVLPVGIGPETGGYQISRSLRFNSADSANLSRTPAGAGDKQKHTYSAWVKRGSLGSSQNIFGAGTSASGPYSFVRFDSSDKLDISYVTTGPTSQCSIQSAAVFRDPSAWYHVVVAVDTTQATAANRIRAYVNGIEQTMSGTQPTQNTNLEGFNTAIANYVGGWTVNSTSYFNGYITEAHFVNAQQLTPSSFGETDPNTGVWRPKKYTGTYGTNGFYLPFNPNPSTATSFTADFLVIGGGGGGAGAQTNTVGGGGGGAGGYRTSVGTSGGGASAESALTLNTGTAYTVTVGAGGAGSAGGNTRGSSGNNSVFHTITSTGGGGGGQYNVSSGVGVSGGSGSGGSWSGTGGAGTANQGYAGGNGTTAGGGGGGGGAGAVGGNASGTTAGNGGNGVASSITGSSVTRAGGGGGASYTGIAGTGGSGGGGNGAVSSGSNAGSPGTANTGGGGGAGTTGGQGGSGVVIIKVPDTLSANFTSGVTYSLSTSVSGFKIYTVTATSTTSEKVTFI